MAAPTLGELALKARLIRGRELEDTLRFQRQGYAEGDFRRLGELLVAYGYCTRPDVRKLLVRQGVTIVECELCATRYNGLGFEGRAECLRCGRGLRPSASGASLVVEDSIACGSGERAAQVLEELHQRNPRLDRYEIRGEVGRGGMGVIYKAYEPRLRRTVALKFMHPGGSMSPEDEERFRREAQAVASLRHPHIVQALAIEQAKGLTYMAMDFVPGVAMEVLTNQGALSVEEIVGVAIKIARGLHHAHEQGVIHRDVKPANIVIDRSLRPYLVDFGVAKQARDGNLSLTSEGEVLGSLAYMAPEYVTKGRVALDRRCDVYGLGVVLYESLSKGLLPYGDPDDQDLIHRLVSDPPIPLLEALPSASPELAKIVDRAIAREPGRRHQSAEALALDLEAWLRTGKGVPEPAEDVFARTASGEELELELGRRRARRSRGGGALAWGSSLALLITTAVCAAGWIYASANARSDVSLLKRRLGMAELRAARALEQSGDLRGALSALNAGLEILDSGLELGRRVELLNERAALHERLGEPERAAADRAEAERLTGG